MTISLRETQSIDAIYYRGKVCEKHPDLEGKRRKKNHECVGCKRDALARRRQSTEGHAARLATQRRAYRKEAEDLRYYRKIYHTIRLRAVDLALARFHVDEVRRYTELWDEAANALIVEGTIPHTVDKDDPKLASGSWK